MSTPTQSFLGGIGLSLPVHALLILNGSVFGISGFVHNAILGDLEAASSVAGLVLGGVAVGALEGPATMAPLISSKFLILSGILVGAGSKVLLFYFLNVYGSHPFVTNFVAHEWVYGRV